MFSGIPGLFCVNYEHSVRNGRAAGKLQLTLPRWTALGIGIGEARQDATPKHSSKEACAFSTGYWVPRCGIFITIPF
jgi:hypothetical protein